MRNKLDNKLDVFDLDLVKNVDNEIEHDINYFYIDKNITSNLELPSNLNKEIKKPFKQIKREKKKNIRYIILDVIIVLACILPIIGVIKPEIFEKVHQIYPVFKNINEFLQKDRIMSILGIEEVREPIEGDVESSRETIYVEEKNVKAPTNNCEAIKLIHSLANTLIQAEYKWQCSEVTPKTIEKAIAGVELIKDDYDRMHLRNSIKKWSKGNFSNAVEVHNYVWEMLDGSVGKAYTLDEKEIKKITDKYFNN